MRHAPIVALAIPLGLLGCLGEARAQPRDRDPGSEPPSAPGPQAAQPAELTTPDAPGAGHLPSTDIDAVGVVRIDGPEGATFERETDSVEHDWETVCTAPCVAHASTAFKYRIAGAGLKPSRGFALRVDSGQTEELHVNGASLPLYVVGWIGVGGGGAAGVTGLFLALWSATSGAFSLPNPSDNPGIFWAIFGAGAAVAAGGLVLVLTNKHTTVSQDVVGEPKTPDPAAATPPPMPPSTPVDTFARLVPTGPAFELPIVSLHF